MNLGGRRAARSDRLSWANSADRRMRLGKGNITIEVWDKRDRKFGSFAFGASH